MKTPRHTLALHSPLWLDNARTAQRQRAARTARWHRRAFPVLLIIATIAVVRFVALTLAVL